MRVHPDATEFAEWLLKLGNKNLITQGTVTVPTVPLKDVSNTVPDHCVTDSIVTTVYLVFSLKSTHLLMV